MFFIKLLTFFVSSTPDKIRGYNGIITIRYYNLSQNWIFFDEDFTSTLNMIYYELQSTDITWRMNLQAPSAKILNFTTHFEK